MKGIFSALGWGIFWTVCVLFTMFFGLIPFGIVCYLIFAGAEKREENSSQKLLTTLMQSERVISQASQMRIFALWHRRLSVAVTTSRIILVSRGLLGGFTMKDIQWKDLTDATLEQNVMPSICGSNLAFRHSNGGVGPMEVLGVPDDIAAEIYSYAQEQEQAWEEKRRIRSMEESRASSGGVFINAAGGSGASHALQEPAPAILAQKPSSNRMFEEIERARSMMDAGIISDAEFNEMKAKIIGAA